MMSVCYQVSYSYIHFDWVWFIIIPLRTWIFQIMLKIGANDVHVWLSHSHGRRSPSFQGRPSVFRWARSSCIPWTRLPSWPQSSVFFSREGFYRFREKVFREKVFTGFVKGLSASGGTFPQKRPSAVRRALRKPRKKDTKMQNNNSEPKEPSSHFVCSRDPLVVEENGIGWFCNGFWKKFCHLFQSYKQNNNAN
jgi:hypothetical protein